MKRHTDPFARLSAMFSLVAALLLGACGGNGGGPDDTGDADADADASDATDAPDTGDAPDTDTSPDIDTDAELATLREWARNPPSDAMERLAEIIGDDEADDYVRERAVFTLVELASRQGDPDAATDALAPLATRPGVIPNLRAAAWANLDLLRARFPVPPPATLALTAEGSARPGVMFELLATARVDASATDVRLSVEVTGPDGALVAHALFRPTAGASEAPFVTAFTPLVPGDYYVAADLRFDTSETAAERVTRRARLHVTDAGGDALIFAD